MAVQNETKLKILLKNLKPGAVALAPWLEELGISRNLQNHYLQSGWLEPIGRGAYKKPNEKVQWPGGVYAMQNQANLKVHVGAITALSLQGLSHNIRFTHDTIYLFSPYKENLPKWFNNYEWESEVFHQQTSFLPANLGIVEFEAGNIPVKMSSSERAIIESLYLAPRKIDLIECYHLMEGLVNLQPRLVQELLYQCNSVRVKRIFLYLAEKANHQWLKFLDLSTLNMGSGNRKIASGGTYISKYQITISKELAEL